MVQQPLKEDNINHTVSNAIFANKSKVNIKLKNFTHKLRQRILPTRNVMHQRLINMNEIERPTLAMVLNELILATMREIYKVRNKIHDQITHRKEIVKQYRQYKNAPTKLDKKEKSERKLKT
eukprot:TRINITY_DN1259_c1_g1_i1.p1 TRINITY_DN1259_c1_g1~~TRINITY_DN1259_c1_g1_i1.p1  ORF type:complete len:122 (+),score=12.81 TRINITY_DN1259_c1_g1_i1:615-980(+)